MVSISEIFSAILHFDVYVGEFALNYGPLIYLVVFLIILCETGLVITPFLPGDSLLFVLGAFAAKGYLNIWIMYFALIIAAVLGDSLNYGLGNYFGEKLFFNNRFFNKKYLKKTQDFYHRHGRSTIILARFIPIVRTFAPFVAGIGKMRYMEFFTYNIVGGIVWVSLFLFGGYFLGGIPYVMDNLTLLIILIILISILPVIYEYIKHKYY